MGRIKIYDKEKWVQLKEPYLIECTTLFQRVLTVDNVGTIQVRQAQEFLGKTGPSDTQYWVPFKEFMNILK